MDLIQMSDGGSARDRTGDTGLWKGRLEAGNRDLGDLVLKVPI